MTDDTLLDMHSQSKKQLPTAKFDQTIVDSGKFGGREFWWPLSSAKISRFFFFNLANFKFGNSVSKALEKQVTMHLKKCLEILQKWLENAQWSTLLQIVERESETNTEIAES